MSVHQFTVKTIDNKQQSLADYKGKTLLIVNTASKCGLTPHYKGLQELYEKYKDQGLVVLGFPCNQFMNQEPGTAEEIQAFCELNYNVTFPLFAKIDVKGEHADPLYHYLVKQTGGDIEWNFVKFLVDGEGNVVKQYGARTEPAELAGDIEKLLAGDQR
ncbi:MAG: glutathione peroxidase [Clostridia bacterium]